MILQQLYHFRQIEAFVPIRAEDRYSLWTEHSYYSCHGSDPNKGKGKAGGRGRGRGRSGGPGSGRWRAEDEPPAEYTTAYIEDHDIRCQWYERYRRILNRLSQVERNNQDRIWFRFRTRSYPHWSGLKPSKTLSKPSNFTRIFCISRDSKSR